MTTITYDGGPDIVPALANVRSFEAAAAAGVVGHEILDGPPVYTLRPAGPDDVELELVFNSETEARDCYTAHKLAAVFEISDPGRALLNFRYVLRPQSTPRMRLDERTMRRWVVVVPIREVLS